MFISTTNLLLSGFTVSSTEGLTATCAAAFEVSPQIFHAIMSNCWVASSLHQILLNLNDKTNLPPKQGVFIHN